MAERPRRANRALLAKLGVIALGMFAFGYALVPFYEKICQVTGLRNIDQPDAVANSQVDASRVVRVEFDSKESIGACVLVGALQFLERSHQSFGNVAAAVRAVTAGLGRDLHDATHRLTCACAPW